MKRGIVVAVAVIAIAGVAAFVLMRGGDKKKNEKVDKPTATKVKPKRIGKTAGDSGGQGAAPARVSYEDDPVGSLRLEGQVLGADGRGVGGVVVAVSSNPERTVKTEDDGSFAFDKLLARRYELSARKGALYGGPVTARLTKTSDPVVLHLKEGATLELTVVDADGRKPIAGAKAELGRTTTRTATAGSDGVAKVTGIGPGWFRLEVSAPGYGSVSRYTELSGAAGTVEKQTVALHRGVPVSGTVVDSSGKPIAGAKVLAESASASFLDGREEEVETDAKGRWKIGALATGSYRFSARHHEHAPGTSDLVTLSSRSGGREGVVIALEAGARISGKVVDKAGNPVSGAAVRVAVAAGSFRSNGVRQVYCDDQGAFEMKGLPRAKLSAVAIHQNASSSVLEIDLTDKAAKPDVELLLDLDGVISGVVVDGAGEPIAEARVSAFPKNFMASLRDWRLRGTLAEVADQEGKFTLRGVDKITYTVTASRPGSARPKLYFGGDAKSGAADAKAGDKDVKIVLEKPGSIVGTVAFEDGKVPETFAIARGWSPPTPFVGTKGKFELTDVPAGKHRLRITGPGILANEKKRIELKPGEKLDVGNIKLEKGRSVRGRVLDAAGTPVAGAKVSAGMFLVGDGTGFSNRMMGGGKEATTKDDGSYVLYGVGEREIAIVADHGTRGRSPVLTVPKGNDDPSIDLHLAPHGVLQGKVTRGGKPVAAMVTAKIKGFMRAQLMVRTGPDGTFRYDKLGPGTYTFTAKKATGAIMITAGGGPGAHMAEATVEAGKTAKVEIKIPVGPTVTVNIGGVGGKPAPNASVTLAKGKLRFAQGQNPGELMEKEDGSVRHAMSMASHGMKMPAKFDNVEPGEYTICAVPLPSMEAMAGDGEAKVEIKIDGKTRPTCKTVTIPGAPDEQTFELAVPPAPSPT